MTSMTPAQKGGWGQVTPSPKRDGGGGLEWVGWVEGVGKMEMVTRVNMGCKGWKGGRSEGVVKVKR